ncbi:uncharacterized protein [Fopius arisanus]|uniref:Myb-like domain-containing protein n=1 Tax=Fopius arisanus TaxID=64838 RepID=A0A9R1SYL9_9HYME|nr:PREDICTED: uncharacterized protein LOC105264389 [Fopius arisanus]
MNLRERFTKKHTEFPNDVEKKKSRWTDEDKEKLLKALQKYGYKDIDKICGELPNKTKGSVRTLINRLNKEAQESTRLNESHADYWLRSGKIEDSDLPISQALKFIAMFEKHPPPQECAGCDFRYKNLFITLSNFLHYYKSLSRDSRHNCFFFEFLEWLQWFKISNHIYYYHLSKATSGHPPVGISRMTHETIAYVMAQTTHEVWPYCRSEITEYIESIEQERTRKTYSRRAKVVVPKEERDSDD